MTKTICKGCGEEFESPNEIIIFCSYKCKCRYNSREYSRKHPERKGRRMSVSNPERYRELMKKNYYNNKARWQSRVITFKLTKDLINIDKILKKECKSCGIKDGLEIHHEVYPTKSLDIIDHILSGEIYYLCAKCHGRLRRNGNNNSNI